MFSHSSLTDTHAFFSPSGCPSSWFLFQSLFSFIKAYASHAGHQRWAWAHCHCEVAICHRPTYYTPPSTMSHTHIILYASIIQGWGGGGGGGESMHIYGVNRFEPSTASHTLMHTWPSSEWGRLCRPGPMWQQIYDLIYLLSVLNHIIAWLYTHTFWTWPIVKLRW